MQLFYFNAPVGIECCVVAANQTQAAKMLCTTGNTLAARGKRYERTEDALPGVRKGLEMAARLPGAIIIREREDGDWHELATDPSETLLTERQRHSKTLRNAQINDAPMTQRSIASDDETWELFLDLGGSKWFRAAVRAAHARKVKAAK